MLTFIRKGYDEEGFLTRRLRKSPRAIVLLDEIEKAHPDVLTVFLQVFDDGRITDTKRGVIQCQNAVFIMTSNLAADEIKAASPMLRKLVERTEDRPEEYTRVVGEFNRGIHPVLKRSLRRDEFLGRINQIVVFLPLNEEEVRANYPPGMFHSADTFADQCCNQQRTYDLEEACR